MIPILLIRRTAEVPAAALIGAHYRVPDSRAHYATSAERFDFAGGIRLHYQTSDAQPMAYAAGERLHYHNLIDDPTED